jgi:hypothetical protein
MWLQSQQRLHQQPLPFQFPTPYPFPYPYYSYPTQTPAYFPQDERRLNQSSMRASTYYQHAQASSPSPPNSTRSASPAISASLGKNADYFFAPVRS